MARERQAGDWDCPDCGAVCFASKETCFRCDRKAGVAGARKEGDWDCPDCGTVIFAGKESCFRCDRRNGVAGARKEGDWDCPVCGTVVFAGKETCFRCDRNGGAGGAPRRAAPAAAAAAAQVTPAVALKALGKAAPGFKSAWVGYCKRYGQGFSDPAKYDEAFIGEFLEHAASLVAADLENPEATGAGAKRPAPESESADGQPEKSARKGGEGAEAAEAATAPPAPAEPEKKKVTMKRAVANEIKRLNAGGGLLAPLRLGAVATALAELGEPVALEVLALLEEQQAEVEDPNEFVRNQAAFRA